ncbi:hypothetical protein AUP68_11171 [Ilyonectria robusta]
MSSTTGMPASSQWCDRHRRCEDGCSHEGKLELITWTSTAGGDRMGWGNCLASESDALKEKFEKEFNSNEEKMYEYWPQGFRWTCCGTEGDQRFGCDHHGNGSTPCSCDFCKTKLLVRPSPSRWTTVQTMVYTNNESLKEETGFTLPAMVLETGIHSQNNNTVALVLREKNKDYKLAGLLRMVNATKPETEDNSRTSNVETVVHKDASGRWSKHAPMCKLERCIWLEAAEEKTIRLRYRQVRTGGPAVNIGVRMDPRVVEGSVNISEQILFVKRMDSANRIALSESEIRDL